MIGQAAYSRIAGQNKITGVEVFLQMDGKMLINAVSLKKKGDKLEIIQEQVAIESLKQLKQQFGVSNPLVLVFNGRGLLHKKITNDNQEDSSRNIYKILPNAQVGDFYLQQAEINQLEMFGSVVRKEIIDQYLQQFMEAGFLPVQVYFGPFILNSIVPLLDNPAELVKIGSYDLTVKNQLISDFEFQGEEISNRKISIAGEQLKQQAAIAFSAAFSYLFPSGLNIALTIPFVDFLKEESKQKQLFKTLGWGILLFFLGVLLINFFMFDYYNKKNGELSERYEKNKGILDYMVMMKTKIEQKNAFIEQSGLKNASRTSFYADRIAMDLPDKIKLTEINIHPLEKKIKAGEAIAFAYKTIIVRGNCKRSSDLNTWRLILNQNNWIEDVQVLNYLQGNADELGEFEIKILVK